MQYPKSGVIGSVVHPGSADNLLGASITTGRVLWLRSMWVYNDGWSGLGGVSCEHIAVTLSDCSVDAIGSGALVKRFEERFLSGTTTNIEFTGPGLKFENGCVVTSHSGFLNRGTCGGAGYEE